LRETKKTIRKNPGKMGSRVETLSPKKKREKRERLILRGKTIHKNNSSAKPAIG